MQKSGAMLQASFKLRLTVCPRLFENALQMHSHCRKADAQLIGDILQPVAAKDRDLSFRRRQIIDLLQIESC